MQQTRLIATGAASDQSFCDGFKPITCSKPSPTTVTINPRCGRATGSDQGFCDASNTSNA